MDSTPSPALFTLLLALLFVAMWLFASWIASRSSGWRRIGQRFGNPGPFAASGEKVRFSSAQIGWANYSGALQLMVSPSGLYLSPIWFFRAFHPPLFIPWSEFEPLPSRWPGVVPWLTLRSVPGVRIRFSRRAFARLRPYLTA